MRKKLCVLLSAAIALSALLCGCTAFSADAGGDLAGQWKTTVPLAPLSADMPVSESELADIGFDLIFNFEQDGSFRAIVDQVSVRKMIDDLVEIVVRHLSDTAQQQGISRQELRETIYEKVDPDAVIEKMEGSFSSGWYRYQNDTLYISDTESVRKDPASKWRERLTVSADKTKLTVTGIESKFGSATTFENLLPLVFEKQ